MVKQQMIMAMQINSRRCFVKNMLSLFEVFIYNE